jgi:hypothetical protein
MLLSNEHMAQYAKNETSGKLISICDIAALVDGPTECFKEECTIERPYFLYDPLANTNFDSYAEIKAKGGSSQKTFVYQGVE